MDLQSSERYTVEDEDRVLRWSHSLSSLLDLDAVHAPGILFGLVSTVLRSYLSRSVSRGIFLGAIRTRRSMLPRRCDHPVCTNVSSDPPGIGGRPSGIRFGLPTDGHRVDTVLELVGTKALNHNHNHNGVQ